METKRSASTSFEQTPSPYPPLPSGGSSERLHPALEGAVALLLHAISDSPNLAGSMLAVAGSKTFLASFLGIE